MAFDIGQARSFVRGVDLSDTPRGIISQDAATEASEVFDKAKNQAQVVGSGVFSFAQGVDAGVREAISDSALLAQLVSNKRVKFEEQPVKWFNEYSSVLQNVGWTIQDAGWNDYSAGGTSAEVNEKIVEVMSVILGPAPAALSIIKSAIGALKAMNPNSSWITIFNRETQKAKIARFQIGLVEKEEGGQVFVSLVGCLIEAENSITQVLFFKWRQANAKFKANSAKVSINRVALADLGPAIRSKIRAYQADYISSIADI